MLRKIKKQMTKTTISDAVNSDVRGGAGVVDGSRNRSTASTTLAVPLHLSWVLVSRAITCKDNMPASIVSNQTSIQI